MTDNVEEEVPVEDGQQSKLEMEPQRFHMTDAQMGNLYRLLREKTYMGAALEMKLDRWYKPNTMVAVVQKVTGLVRRDPGKYFVLPESVKEIDYALSQRSFSKRLAETRLERDVASQNQEFKNILEDTRAGLLDILHRKVKRIGRSNKKIDEMNLGTLATSLAIIIDKLQLVRGEATENVAVLAKIDQNISPEAALEMVLKMRETNLDQKNNKK